MVRANEYHALKMALKNGHTQIVKLLLASDPDGLIWTLRHNHINALKLLLKAGADISVLPSDTQKYYKKWLTRTRIHDKLVQKKVVDKWRTIVDIPDSKVMKSKFKTYKFETRK